MKRLLLSASAAFALIASPVSAQDSGEPGADAMAQMGEMFAGLFTSEPLTPEQEARVPAAMELVDVMMPEGFYVEMMDEMIGTTMGPVMEMLSGAQGAEFLLLSRLNVEPESLEALTPEQKLEIAAMLDPGFTERGSVMQTMMNEIMVEAAVLVEPGFREGMAKAYAIRFDTAQLAEIAAFFGTETGGLYARESIKIMADPQVMSASMEALPAMMEQFGGMGSQLEAKMAALPPERDVNQLSAAERSRLAALLGVEDNALEDIVAPPASETGDETDPM